MEQQQKVNHKKELRAEGKATVTASVSVTRRLNETRLAVLGIMVAIGLGSAALASGWWQRPAAGFGALAASVAIIGLPWPRNHVMNAMHKLTGS